MSASEPRCRSLSIPPGLCSGTGDQALLWRRQWAGVIIALALSPLEFVFWIGFALPLGPVAAFPRTARVVLAWPSLSRSRA